VITAGRTSYSLFQFNTVGTNPAIPCTNPAGVTLQDDQRGLKRHATEIAGELLGLGAPGIGFVPGAVSALISPIRFRISRMERSVSFSFSRFCR